MEHLPNKLWNKDFVLFLIASVQAALGSSLSGIVLSFLVLKLTHSPSAMAITLALKFLPAFFTPIVATFVDRIKLKSPLIIGNFLRGAALIILSIGVQLGYFHLIAIYTVALFNGIISTIYCPANQSLIPTLIPENQLIKGNSLLAMSNQSMSIIGLAAGGLMVTLVGPSLSLYVEGICYLIVGVMLFFVRMPLVHKENLANSFWKDFKLGLKLIYSSKMLSLLIIAGFFVSAVLAPLDVLIAVHMTMIGRGAFGYGLFMALVIIGMIIGNACIMRLGESYDNFYSILLGWFGFGFAFLGMGLLNSFYFSLSWGILLGISLALINTGIVIILQKVAPVNFRGRVFGTMRAVSQIGIPVSLFFLSYVIKITRLKDICIFSMLISLFFATIFLAIRNKYDKSSDTVSSLTEINNQFELDKT